MCGIVGFSNLKDGVLSYKNVIYNMTEKLSRRGPDEYGYFFDNHLIFGHRRLIITDADGGRQPMTATVDGVNYTICYNGQLYNTEDIRKELIDNGFCFDGYSDTEVILKGFICFGYNLPRKLNGVFSFAIWNDAKKELYIARDHFGIKPLYYTLVDNTLIFASEIKAIVEHPLVNLEIDEMGICELFGIGPSHSPGKNIFKNIFELKPAHFLIFNDSGLHFDRYWNLKTKEHTDNLVKTSETVRFLLEDSIKRQLVSDVPLCTFLSGGLDSSIVTKIASDHYVDCGMPALQTYSVDYVDNDKNFVKSDFQPNSDNYYIDIMQKKLQTNHKCIVIDTPELAKALEDAMVARDLPGMADVDSSLLLFCKNVKANGSTVAVSGECADEIFAGYPWFFREDALNSNTFPWSIALSERQKLLHPDISKKVDLKDYIDSQYKKSLSEVEFLESDSLETREKRKISHLTCNWFMQTLLDRSDRMSLYSGLDIRVPFCDYRIVEYMWNVPWEMKALNGREKGLLRFAVKDLLPKEIVDRKKSPYPKTHNPTYLACVKSMLSKIMEDKNSPINNLLNREYILEILDTDGKAFSRPWFGQLMTGPQLMAYLCQVNMWLEKYQPKIEI